MIKHILPIEYDKERNIWVMRLYVGGQTGDFIQVIEFENQQSLNDYLKFVQQIINKRSR